MAYAESECENSRVLHNLSEHFNQSIFYDTDNYLIRWGTTFSSFALDFFKEDSRELYNQIYDELVNVEEIRSMQLKRYENIYYNLNQKFSLDYTVPLEGNGTDSQINIDEDSEPYFRIFPIYEKLLSPVVQLQLKRLNNDLIAAVRGLERSKLWSFEQSLADEQSLKQLLNREIQIRFKNIKLLSKQKHLEGELSHCQMQLYINQKSSIIVQYWVHHFSEDNSVYLMRDKYQFDQYDISGKSKIAKYLIEKSR